MRLSKDPVKRAIRDEWYWPTMAELFHHNKGEQIVMLPGSHEWDAVTVEKCLKISRRDMFCVDNSWAKLAWLRRHFKNTVNIPGDVFEVLESLGKCAQKLGWYGTFGAVDLDLCSCANPSVIEGLKSLRKNHAIANGCAIGLTICRRWKPDAEQDRMIKAALAPCKEVDRRSYTNGLTRSHMVTMIYQI